MSTLSITSSAATPDSFIALSATLAQFLNSICSVENLERRLPTARASVRGNCTSSHIVTNSLWMCCHTESTVSEWLAILDSYRIRKSTSASTPASLICLFSDSFSKRREAAASAACSLIALRASASSLFFWRPASSRFMASTSWRHLSRAAASRADSGLFSLFATDFSIKPIFFSSRSRRCSFLFSMAVTASERMRFSPTMTHASSRSVAPSKTGSSRSCGVAPAASAASARDSMGPSRTLMRESG
mmetsp:Transcript_37813/g.86488  ORF Transcript_37813/g.86488 Transcript_37813/m.86488 type:complete len:246 (-) Transcript_37813:24-761(-)